MNFKNTSDIMTSNVASTIMQEYTGVELREKVMEESVKELIAGKGFDPVFGARPIKRMIQRMIEDPLSLKILNGEFKAGDEIKMDVSDGTIVFRK